MASNDQPLKPHPRHYGPEPLVFAVGTHLYRIPTNLMQGSPQFRDMLEAPQVGDAEEGRSDSHPIVLDGITSEEMDYFLDVLKAK